MAMNLAADKVAFTTLFRNPLQVLRSPASHWEFKKDDYVLPFRENSLDLLSFITKPKVEWNHVHFFQEILKKNLECSLVLMQNKPKKLKSPKVCKITKYIYYELNKVWNKFWGMYLFSCPKSKKYVLLKKSNMNVEKILLCNLNDIDIENQLK